MSNLYICNASSNYISKVNLLNNLEDKIYLSIDKKLLGLHGMDIGNSKLYVATNHNHNFFEVDIKNRKIRSNYIGMFTNDLRLKNNYMYLICGENNCLVIYDMIEKQLRYEIKCGNYPHSMDICNKNKLISITNMYNNQITLIDYEENDFIKNIKTRDLPMKSKFYRDGRYIFVCESNLGNEVYGTFSVYNSFTGEKCVSITLDKSPIDMCFDYSENTIFVSNYLGNSISIIDLFTFKEISRIEICGNPRGINKIGRFLYVTISDKDKLLKYDIYTKNEEFIKTGLEPTCMCVY